MGKSTAVLALSQLVDAVIYADASAMYRDLSIGVAKPSLEERAILPHFMLDLLNLDEQMNVADFVQKSDAIIADLAREDKVALLSGGTLYYLRHFLYGLPTTPPASEASRAYVEQMARDIGQEALYAHLTSIDPISAERLAWQDSYRVSRALEVYYDSGKPLSSFLLEKDVLRDRYDFCLIELVRPREELYARINDRVEAMWQAGLVAEVEDLKRKGLNASMPASKAIGYRQFFMEGLSLAEIKERIKKESRNYAKRQLTFLRSLPINYRLPADDITSLKQCVQSFLFSR